MRRIACIALFGASACTADFLLGDGESSDGGAGSSGAGESASSTMTGGGVEGGSTTSADPTSGDPSGDPTSGAPTGDPASGDPSGDPTSGESSATTTEPTTTEASSVESTLEGGEDPTTGGETTGGGDGVGVCPETPNDGCEDVPACDLYGDGETAVCWADACHPDAAATCEGLEMEPCIAAPLCRWDSDIEGGTCLHVACGDLPMGDCLDEPACAWNGESCNELDCPACGELSMAACAKVDGCTWREAGEICVTD